MSYSVRVAAGVKRKILAFRVRDAGSEIYSALERLGEDPRLGVQIKDGPLEGRMSYTFRVLRPPGVFRFTVIYLFHADEEHLDVVAFGVLVGDPPRLVNPNEKYFGEE